MSTCATNRARSCGNNCARRGSITPYCCFAGRIQPETILERTADIFGQVSRKKACTARGPFVSNVDPEGLTPTGALPFHSDKCFTDRPLRGLILAAYEVPPPSAGGDTLFANVALAYDHLPPELREKVERLKITHVGSDRTTHLEMAYKHPVTGKKVLFYSTWFFDSIPGMDAQETEAFREVLDSYVDSPRRRYTGTAGKPATSSFWDNITLQHARADFDPTQRRHLRRIQIIAKDELPGTSGEAASKIAKEERRVGQV